MPRRSKSKLANESKGAFTISVNDLTQHLLSGSTEPYQGLTEREIRESANGLAFLSRLLAEYMTANKNTATYASIGLTDAIGILEYLRTGRAHPISKHIDGLRSPEFRKHIGLPERGASEKNKFDDIKRANVVGAMLALMQAKNIRRDAAIRSLIKIVADCDYELTKSKIIGWQNDFEVDGNIGPEAFCNHILDVTKKAATPIEEALAHIIRTSWDVAIPVSSQ